MAAFLGFASDPYSLICVPESEVTPSYISILLSVAENLKNTKTSEAGERSMAHFPGCIGGSLRLGSRACAYFAPRSHLFIPWLTLRLINIRLYPVISLANVVKQFGIKCSSRTGNSNWSEFRLKLRDPEGFLECMLQWRCYAGKYLDADHPDE